MSKEKLEELKQLLFQDKLTDYGKRQLVEILEKQQKEIEMLKKITQTYNAIGGETFGDDRIIVCSMKYFNDGYFKRNYIWKDKIREDIKRFEKLQEQAEPVLQDIKHTRADLIKYLKELIGE